MLSQDTHSERIKELVQFATAFGLACFYGRKCDETGPAGCKGLVEVHGNVDIRYVGT
jgi:hypothetical protein